MIFFFESLLCDRTISADKYLCIGHFSAFCINSRDKIFIKLLVILSLLLEGYGKIISSASVNPYIPFSAQLLEVMIFLEDFFFGLHTCICLDIRFSYIIRKFFVSPIR